MAISRLWCAAMMCSCDVSLQRAAATGAVAPQNGQACGHAEYRLAAFGSVLPQDPVTLSSVPRTVEPETEVR